MTTHHTTPTPLFLAWLPRPMQRWYLQGAHDHYLEQAMAEVETARSHNEAAAYYLDLAAQARSQLDECKG